MKTLALLPFFLVAFQLFAQENTIESQVANPPSIFDEIQLFPNPTSEIIFIRNGDAIESYKIIDMKGQTVQSGIQNAQIISLIDLPIGFYWIEMQISDQTKRVKIQKY
jgi:hypothetical protein